MHIPVVRGWHGGVPERPKGTDCKSVGNAFGGSNPPPSTIFMFGMCREQRDSLVVMSQKGIAAGSRHPFQFHLDRLKAGIAQLVEHQPSKLRVAGSRPVSRSNCLA